MHELNASLTPLLPKSGRSLAIAGLGRLLAKRPLRVILAGGPKAGKTTLAKSLSLRARSSDELIGLGWSESSASALHWFNEPGPWVCEGTTMPRALRKWLAIHSGSPADLIVWLGEPLTSRSRGQHIMALGCATVWNQILPELLARETRIISL